MSSKKNSGKAGKPKQEIKVRAGKSSLADFVKKNAPTNKEVEEFDRYVKDEVKDERIEESLSQIYQNENGEQVDITKLERKKSWGVFGWIMFLLFALIALTGIVWAYYFFFYTQAQTKEAIVDMSINGPAEVKAAEEFVYRIDYKNPTNASLENVLIKVVYPANFIFLDSDPEIGEDKTVWNLPKVAPLSSGGIKIKGRLADKAGEKGIILANMSWSPSNSEAQFRKEDAHEIKITGIGLDFSFVSAPQVLVDQTSRLIINYQPKEDNYLKNFQLRIEPQENIEFIQAEIKKEEGGDLELIEDLKNNLWQIYNIDNQERSIELAFKVIKKIGEDQTIPLSFEYAGIDDKYYPFFTKELELNVIKNDLNLSLFLNGSANDQGVNFSDTLNYSLAFSNKGENNLKNIAIMAVIDSEALDWTTFKASHNGLINDNTVSWSHREVTNLRNLGPGEEGMVDFSIKLLPFKQIKKTGNNYRAASYAQFGIGETEEGKKPLTIDETRSNSIVALVNSDLELKEEARYFNEDNIAVGLGPLPPKIGDTTSYRIFWEANNSLHKLKNLRVQTKLPKYVRWVSNQAPTVGRINYDNKTHEVIWEIGDLPISEFAGKVEFDISVAPTAEDQGKVLALTAGSAITAYDEHTNSQIILTSSGKTTRLEDDEIGISDGIIR